VTSTPRARAAAANSTAQAELVARAGTLPGHWLWVDPDHFKDALL
jgi:hypothetical protein